MVSFSCEVCNDTMTKKKLDQHRQRCYDAYFTCIDCSVTFVGTDYRNHTQCISEAEKYEKSLYKGKPSKQNGKAAPAEAKVDKQTPKKEENKTAAVKSIKSTEKSTESVTEDAKKSSSKKEKTKKDKKSAKTSSVDLTKYAGGSLSKVLKSIAKDTKTDKKDLMKKLHLELVDGKVVLTL